jgi:flavin-dependent dehydrogenase
MLEKDQFPRPKVCGEFLSASALDSLTRLNLRQTIESCRPESIERGIVHLPRAGTASFRLATPAIGISRFAFDDLLARGAQSAGAEVRFGARVVSVRPGPGGFHVRFAGSPEQVCARAAIGAWGRWDSMDRALARGFLTGHRRFLGWSRDYAGDTASLAGLVQLYIFPGGYCGLSRVENATANLAGVISEKTRGQLRGGWDGVLAYARGRNPGLEASVMPLTPGPVGFLGTGPVFFTAKPPAENGILMAGDAAGVLDPFSGEGQSTALASGILAAETIERGLQGEFPMDRLSKVYAQGWRRRFHGRFAWSRILRRMILNPTVAEITGRVAGDRVVRIAVRALERSHS